MAAHGVAQGAAADAVDDRQLLASGGGGAVQGVAEAVERLVDAQPAQIAAIRRAAAEALVVARVGARPRDGDAAARGRRRPM